MGEVLTVPEVCSAAKISRSTLWRLWAANCGPRRIQIGRAVRVRAIDLELWLDGRAQS